MDKYLIENIIKSAQKWVDEKKSEGWTKEDFSRELTKFLEGKDEEDIHKDL